MTDRSDRHLPDPNAALAIWGIDPETRRVSPKRSADFWRELTDDQVACDLCYRGCVLKPGEVGWCRYRLNEGGGSMQLAPKTHGVLSSVVRQQRGYQADPFLTYKPGATSLFIGATYCTAGCSFCMSTEITWRPERVPWAFNGEMSVGTDGGQYGYRSVFHPEGVVEIARQWGCTQIEFGINEPTLSFEFTYDVARLAKRAHVDVVIETNGFSLPPVVAALAPFVDAVDLGIKGSGDPAFYAKWMHSEGAMPHVLRSAEAWRAAGVHLIVGDVIAPPQMQSDEEFADAAHRLYSWIAEHLGPHTPTLVTPMFVPGPQRPVGSLPWNGFLLAAGATEEDFERYTRRLAAAIVIARESGLAYAHTKSNDEVIACHGCGASLLRFRSPMLCCEPCTMAKHFCSFWTHEQHVTASRCDSCGVQVPIVTLTPGELEATRQQVLEAGRGAQARRWRADLPLVGVR